MEFKGCAPLPPSVVVRGDGWHGRLGGCHHCLHNFDMAAGKKRLRLQRSSLHISPIRKASAPPLSTVLGEREYSSLTFQPAGESPKNDALVELRGRLRQTKDAPVYLTTSEMVDVSWRGIWCQKCWECFVSTEMYFWSQNQSYYEECLVEVVLYQITVLIAYLFQWHHLDHMGHWIMLTGTPIFHDKINSL